MVYRGEPVGAATPVPLTAGPHPRPRDGRRGVARDGRGDRTPRPDGSTPGLHRTVTTPGAPIIADKYTRGTAVKWKWADDWARGKVTKVYTGKITRTLKGTEVTRDADDDDPAYLIEQEDGDEVLKSHSEVKKDS